MADRERKLYSVGEAIEAIFTDQDSANDNFDCRSDVEYCPDSEDDSANEENDMEDDTFVLPPSHFSQDVETVSNDQEGNCFTNRIMYKISFSVFSKSKNISNMFILYIYTVLQAHMSWILTYNLLHLHLSQGNKVLHYHNPLHPKELLKNWTKEGKKKIE